jgi:hypothetical protein
MVMVSRLAPNVRGPRVTDERPNGAGPSQQLDCPVNGGDADTRPASADRVEELGGGEAALAVGDQVEDGLALPRQPGVVRKRESSILGHRGDDDNDSQSRQPAAKARVKESVDARPSHRE